MGMMPSSNWELDVFVVICTISLFLLRQNQREMSHNCGEILHTGESLFCWITSRLDPVKSGRMRLLNVMCVYQSSHNKALWDLMEQFYFSPFSHSVGLEWIHPEVTFDLTALTFFPRYSYFQESGPNPLNLPLTFTICWEYSSSWVDKT